MEKNYIKSMPRLDLEKVKMMTWKELYAIDFKFDAEFMLPLVQDQELYAEEVIRILPKKRLVVAGTWLNKPVVAKLFFDLHHAKQHMEKDVAGIHILRENKIPTPHLYYQGMSADKRIYVLIFERIYESKTLQTLWREKETPESLLSLLKYVTIEIATQHVLGCVQEDLHLKNFLITKKRIYTLDGGQIKQYPPILPKKQSMNNLALFLSQLGVVTSLQEKLFKHYAKARGWLIKNEDMEELFLLIRTWNNERWQRYEKKIFRESSDFARHKDLNTLILYDRAYAKPEFIAFLADPERMFDHPSSIILKAGRSATVIKVTLDNNEFVVKRYNMKNKWHQIRRALRQTRASASWRLAQKLKLFDVQTAKPIAFIENRFLGFRSISYYVTEYISGIHVGDYLAHVQSDQEKVSMMIEKVTALLKNFAKLKMTHGDLKMTNILIDQQAQPVLIDLDGTIEHASELSLQTTWKKEIKRFLENFNDNDRLQEKFSEALIEE